MRVLYPEIEPYAVQPLDVGDGHVLHVEFCGNPDGLPVVFLHGGPGGGCKAYHRQFFDPARYHIVLLDQRGCTRSKPRGSLLANTTAHLVGDLERIREHAGFEDWVVFGGSWGATLALAYAETHPERVKGLVLRGSFLARPRDLDWFVGASGAARVFPDEYARLIATVPEGARRDIIGYANEVMEQWGDDWRTFAAAWSRWSGKVVMFSLPPPEPATTPPPDPAAPELDSLLADTAIEIHYAQAGYFLRENQLLEDISLLPDVPVHIVHGRRDMVCPVESAWELKQVLPGAELTILHQSGHLASETGMIDALVGATDAMADELGVETPD